jgi:DNA polymerase III epsilon subunit-like protein
MIPRIVSLDVETTGLADRGRGGGLDIGDHQIIQYAACMLAPDFAAELPCAVITGWVMPTRECDPGAAKVNGFDRALWAARNAVPYGADDAAALAGMLDDAIVLSSNPEFDRAFVAGEAARLGLAPPRWSHRSIDVASLAAPLLLRGALEKTGLEYVAATLGITYRAHDAVEDACAAIKAFVRLTNLYLPVA